MAQNSHKTTCPFLVRVFYSLKNQNDGLELFKDPAKLPVDRQLQLHFWFDTTLRDICQIIKAVLPSARSQQYFRFSRINCDSKDVWSKKQLGTIFLHKRGDRQDDRTLEQCGFRVGDYLDVSINYK